MRHRSDWRLIFVVLALVFAAFGCEEDHMRQGKAALVAEQPDVAEKHFQAVLKSEPDNIEAKRLMADVYRAREDFSKAEKQLQKLWKGQGFGDEKKELTARQKTTKSLMEGQYDELYKEWANSIDTKKDPDEFERVVTAGLEIDPKSIQLNNMLVEFYEKRGNRLVEEGKKLEAADAYDEILELRTTQKKRDEAEKMSKNLRLEVFKTEATEHFEKNVAPNLEEEQWDAEKKLFTLNIEQEVDRSLRPKNPEDKKKARMAAAKSLALGLRNVTVQATPLDQKADFSKVGVPDHKVVNEDFKRGEYVITAKVSLDDVLKTAFAVKEQARKKAEKEAEDGGDGDDAEKPAKEPGADAGAEGTGSDADSEGSDAK